MKFLVIRARHLAILAASLIAIPILFAAANKTMSVFNAGGREIPIYSVERDDNKIALTFDCAWNDDDVDSILDTLDEYGCKATFFVTGDWAEKYGDSLEKICQRGHEIGNHSYNHADYTKLSKEDMLADMEKCDEIIENVTGARPYLFRAPSGGYNDAVVKTSEESGRVYIQWSVDGIDYGGADADSIYERSTAKTRAGDIILLHNGTDHTAEILPDILKTLCAEYEPVIVSELIYKDNFTIDHTGRQIKK